MLKSDEPGLVVEVINGYRLKEKMPENIGELTTPVGVPEILRSGDDVTLVTYGALCRIALEAAELLSNVGIDVEVIDVQSHRPAYGSDGDYWSKPNTEQIFEAIYDMMNEAEPGRYPVFYR